VFLLNQKGLPWVNRLKQSQEILDFENYNELLNELKGEYSNEVVSMSEANFQMQLMGSMQLNKIPAVYFFDEGKMEPSIEFMSTEKNVSDLVQFFAYEQPSPKIMKDLGIKNLPALIFIDKDPNNNES
jgi:hypothetical protein